MHDLAAQIAAAMWEYFQRTSHTEDWLRISEISEIGVNSARHLGDDALLSWLLNSLGQVHSLLGHFSASSVYLTEALAVRRRLGDRSGEAAVLNSLAIALYYEERFEDALEHHLSAYEVLDEGSYRAIVLNNIGELLLRLKRHDEALAHLQKALAIRHANRDGYDDGVTEGLPGDTYLDLGDFAEAVNHYQRALASYRKAVREARQAWQAALPILAKNNDPRAAELRDRLADASGT